MKSLILLIATAIVTMGLLSCGSGPGDPVDGTETVKKERPQKVEPEKKVSRETVAAVAETEKNKKL